MPLHKTKIEWCTHTWNPVTGCLHDCPYCYARGIARHFGDVRGECGIYHFLGCPYEEYSPGKGDWRVNPYPYGFDPTFYCYRLDDPAHHRTPSRIFVSSMGDLFGDWIPDIWIKMVFAACDNALWHTYLFLTKDIHGYCDRFDSGLIAPRENMWFGQSWDGERTGLTDLREYGCNTFLSIEPLLNDNLPLDSLSWFDWVIVGAETGNRKGKVVPERAWIERLCAKADALHIPVFMKDSLLPIMSESGMRREFPANMT